MRSIKKYLKNNSLNECKVEYEINGVKFNLPIISYSITQINGLSFILNFKTKTDGLDFFFQNKITLNINNMVFNGCILTEFVIDDDVKTLNFVVDYFIIN